MRKLILSFITFISFFSLSHGFEANIKVGYDFFRHSTHRDFYNVPTNREQNYGRGFVLGVEVFPFTFKEERIKLGVGMEYNFGEKTVYYDSVPDKRYATMLPLYSTIKFTYYRPKKIDLNLYTFARFGYAFARSILFYEDEEDDVYFKTSTFYYGLGLGLDYKYFLAEILYDCKYYVANYYHFDFHHKVGVRLGVQLGSQHFKKPQIK